MTNAHRNIWWLLILLILSCLLGAGYWVSPFSPASPPEPTYEGKSLSELVQQSPFGRDEGTRIAVQQIGTNAIPFLIYRMQGKDSAIKSNLRRVLPMTWIGRLKLDSFVAQRQFGMRGLAALGTNAGSAVPALIKIAEHHPDKDGRASAVWTLGRLGSAAEPAIPFLVQSLTNETAAIRWPAAEALGEIQRRPDICVPALIRYLEFAKRPEVNMRSGLTNTRRFSAGFFELDRAVRALDRFGPEAKASVPALLPVLDDPDPSLRGIVTGIVQRLDPKALENR